MWDSTKHRINTHTVQCRSLASEIDLFGRTQVTRGCPFLFYCDAPKPLEEGIDKIQLDLLTQNLDFAVAPRAEAPDTGDAPAIPQEPWHVVGL